MMLKLQGKCFSVKCTKPDNAAELASITWPKHGSTITIPETVAEK
jgi:hypothetical protein